MQVDYDHFTHDVGDAEQESHTLQFEKCSRCREIAGGGLETRLETAVRIERLQLCRADTSGRDPQQTPAPAVSQ